MAFTTRTLVGSWPKGNVTGKAAGTVYFTPNARLVSATEDSIIPMAPVRATLDASGAISVSLVCTDNAGINPVGWAWTVVERIVGAPVQIYDIPVVSGVGNLNLADITPYEPAPALVQYVLASTVGQVGGPAGPLDAAGYLPAAQVELDMDTLTDHSLAGWTFPLGFGSSAGNANYAVAGQLYMARFRLYRSALLVRAHLNLVTAPGGADTGSFVGLYDSTGTLRAQTADQSAAWVGTGMRSPAFVTPYQAAPGVYYFGLLVATAAAALPAWMQSSPGGAMPGLLNLNQSGATLKYSNVGSGLSVLPASVTLSSLVAQQRGLWIAAAT